MIGADFDKTLTNYDTFIPFLCYYSTQSILKRLGLILVIVMAVALKMRLVSNDVYKSFAVKVMFRGDHYVYFNKRAREYSSRIELNGLGQQMARRDKLIILTASFKEYIEPLFPNAVIYGTELDIDDKGYIKGLITNLYGYNKLFKYRENHNEKMTIFYSDSPSDLCLKDVSIEFKLVEVKR